MTHDAPPRDPALAAIARAWHQATGRAPGRETFQEAGGDSLGLLELVFVLERACGRSLPLDRFHMDMTLEALLQATALPEPDTISSPVVLCPASNGDAPYLATFRRLCAMPFVTVEYPGWRASAAPGFSLDTMVQATLEAIPPSGPVRLAGTSMGGLVAYEAARRLEAACRTVAWLGILDAPAPGQPGPDMQVGAAPGLVRALWWETARLLTPDGSAPRRRGALLGQLLAHPWAAPARRLALAARPRARNTAGLAHWTAHYAADHLRKHACRSHQASRPATRLRAPATLFRCEATDPGAAPDYGWSALIEHVTIVPVPGNHFSRLLEPHVHTAAAAFRTALPP